ncbi:MAG: helix-turn-helix domain-containing protein, partial [Pseudomonadota bacterium]
SGERLYDWTHIAPSGDRVAASCGAETPCAHDVSTAGAPPFDILVVVAGGRPERFDHRPSFAYLRRAARAGVRLGGVSGGPVVLAAAGVMAGRRMTVHWEHAAALAEAHPDLALERSLYVIDRDRLTAAGGAAPLDMMRELIGAAHGPALAAAVSDWFHHNAVRRAEDPQRSAQRFGVRHPKLVAALEAMEARLAAPLPRTEVAAMVGLSDRQLGRLFAAKTGRGFAAHYRELRLARARDLLAQTAMSVTEIAYACGFASPSHFSTAYKAWAGASPRRAAERRAAGI